MDNFLNNITNLLDKYKTQLLILSIIIIVLYFSFSGYDSVIRSEDDKYIIPISATNEEMDEMKVYNENKCQGEMPVKLNLSKDDSPLETCALYAKGKGWKYFNLNNGICATGQGIINKTCKKGTKSYHWSKNKSVPKVSDNIIVIKQGSKLTIPMFDQPNFGGVEYKLDEGKYPKVDNLGFDINNIKSFLLPPMSVLKIYTHNNFQGRLLKLVNPTGFVNDKNINLLDIWKKNIGSVEIAKYSMNKVKPYLNLYSECNFKGNVRHLGEGEFSVSDLMSLDIREDDIKSFEVGPYAVAELFVDDSFRQRLVRVVNSTEYKKKWNKCLDKQIRSIKIIPFEFYKSKVLAGVPCIESFHNLNQKSYKIDLEEGEYNDLKGTIYKLIVAPNSVVLFKKAKGKDEIFVNQSKNRINRICDIDCADVEFCKIVRYDEYHKSDDKYVIVYEYPDYNSEKDGFEVKLSAGNYTMDDLKKMGVRDPISSLKISPLTKVILHSTEKDYDQLFDNNDSNYHKMIRNLNVNEIIGYEKMTKPIFHNWWGKISSIEVH